MMIVDDILNWARGRGYTAVYGSAEQVNEMLNNTPFADSKDGTAVIMHLVTDSATVDGHDRAVMAVYFASLCDFDFDGESLLPEQERLKGIGKELLNDIRTGNVMTYSDPRWQYGYDDYAENVAWVCLRVTLTASAADCVPLSPEPPTPPTPPTYQYNVFCPQILGLGTPGQGSPNPCYLSARSQYKVTMALTQRSIRYPNITWVGDEQVSVYQTQVNAEITEANIQSWKRGIVMTAETEQWLRERIGMKLVTMSASNIPAGKEYMLVSSSATWYESKAITVI